MRIPPAYSAVNVCDVFQFEQEHFFSYNSLSFLDDSLTELSVLLLTEPIIRVCVALLIDEYAWSGLWYVPPDIISFSKTLVMDMAVVLGSLENMGELMEML